jgi:group II intron reverse transcriptase/maturase
MPLERRRRLKTVERSDQLRHREELGSEAKPYVLDRWEVWEAYLAVKANAGGAGVDGVRMKEFEQDLKSNLYKLWNRLSSGSYFPPPVRRVEIPKASGGTRALGIPTIADRIAQTVIKRRIEPLLERLFDADSYGYREGGSAHDALERARQRCWRRQWVLEVDIKGFFDTIDQSLLMRAVGKHVPCRYARMYIERWLKADCRLPSGIHEARTQGTPQGGVISPLLANLFLHYAFDAWVRREVPDMEFERYADDIVCHCRSRAQAEGFLVRLRTRFNAVGLALHSAKTRVVYCAPKGRSKHADVPVRFTFLGYEFRPRTVINPAANYMNLK